MRSFLFAIFFLTFIFHPLITKAQDIKEAYQESYMYEKVEDYENAIKSLSSILKQYPDAYTVNLRLGWLYYLNKNYSNSIQHYQTAIKASSASIEAKLGYLLPLIAQSKFSEVETISYQILTTDYYNYYGNLRLLYALRMQKKYDLAEQVANKVLSIYPTDVSFLVELGLAKHFQGDKEKAIDIFWNVLVLDPENVAAKEYMGED